MLRLNVLVEGNMIMAVSADPIEAEGATLIDGGGRTLTPGMIEAHGHVTYASPLLDIVLNQDPNERAIRSARRANDYLEVPGARTTLPVSRRCVRRERQYLIAALTEDNGQDANEDAGRESGTMALTTSRL